MAPPSSPLDGVLDQASGHQILADLILLRLLEVAGIALVVAATPTLARSLKRDPAHAVLIGVGSPLVLLSLVAGSHNDALMVGLLMAGLAVAKRFGTVPGVILCALAAGVKSPAALGVLFLGWVWAGPAASTRRRIGHTVGAGLIALATMEVMSLVSGTGWGWVRTTTTADASFTGVTPVNMVARAVSIVSHVLQVPISTMDARPVFSVLGLLVAVYVGYRLLLMRSPQDGVVRCLGLTLLVLALLGPIVWAWYVTWGVIVLAPAVTGRLRSALIVISTFWAFAGVTAVHGIYMRLDPHLRADRPAPGGHAARRGHHAAWDGSPTGRTGPACRACCRGCWPERGPAPALAPAPVRRPDATTSRRIERSDQSAVLNADTTRPGRRRTTSSPATPLRAPYSSARSAPMYRPPSRVAQRRTSARSSLISTTPSTTTKLNGGRSSSTQIDALGSRLRFRPLTVDSPVLKTSDPSTSTSNHTGAMWGRPSARTVASFPVRGGSAVRNARTCSSAMER